MDIAGLHVLDIRSRLPRANWIIGRRKDTTSITVHYNGPELIPSRQSGAGLIAQLSGDAHYQMQPGWGGTKDGAPGLMYHLVVDAGGTIYLCRDIDEILWHCAHQDGNGHGLSVHFPLGGQQDATPLQWQRGAQLLDALRTEYNIPIARVVGHIEWKHATACPGRLQPRVVAYRAGLTGAVLPTPTPADNARMQVLPALTSPANVRQGPGRSFKVAGRMKPGTILYIDVVRGDGEPVGGDRRWAHMARVRDEQADLGFVSMTLLRPAP